MSAALDARPPRHAALDARPLLHAALDANPPLHAAPGTCAHCGLPTAGGTRFCCPGCQAAFALIDDLGLGRYYRDRLLDPTARPPRPDDAPPPDLARHVTACPQGWELTLAVDGLQCGACVWLIEAVLARAPGLRTGRLNMTTHRLHLVWAGNAAAASGFAAQVEALGYRLVPITPQALTAARDAAGQRLLRALAVVGFAGGNVMFLALGTWFGDGMGAGTRSLLHWLAALIALPAIAYGGRIFFASAVTALRHGRTNMDVPISIGVLLVTALSLWQTAIGGGQTYFESGTMLLFFLLAGRVMDHSARGRARDAAEQLLALQTGDVTRLGQDGATTRCGQNALVPGDRIVVAMGERIGADGILACGPALLDASLVTGESLPIHAAGGASVFAGTVNLGAPLTIRVTAAGGSTLLAECVRLIEAAESRRGRYVVLADRVARAYAPVVHVAALATFLFWMLAMRQPVAPSLLAACAVLIITCPCALALAVPVVQVVATGRLFAAGILLKSPTALERLAQVDTVCFDKTGTLTEPRLRLAFGHPACALAIAASIAACSRHPLARALHAAAGPVVAATGVVEHPGLGLACAGARLGSAAFCGVETTDDDTSGPALWLARPGLAPQRFGFAEHLRADAAETVARLRAMGLQVRLLSGDRTASVAAIAALLGIDAWQAGCSPADKHATITGWERDGARVLMVGDGLNDGPALSAASVSASPATAADLSQTVADLIYQGRHLAPVALAIATARKARRVMRQNLGLALGYNLIAVPLAMAGLVTPWLAAAAMSASSLLVMANSARLRWRPAA